MADVKNIITLGIGTSPGKLVFFLTTGLGNGIPVVAEPLVATVNLVDIPSYGLSLSDVLIENLFAQEIEIIGSSLVDELFNNVSISEEEVNLSLDDISLEANLEDISINLASTDISPIETGISDEDFETEIANDDTIDNAEVSDNSISLDVTDTDNG